MLYELYVWIEAGIFNYFPRTLYRHQPFLLTCFSDILFKDRRWIVGYTE